MTETGTTELKAEIRQLATLVDAVHRLFLDGQLVELGRLEAQIAACCSAVCALPPASGLELQPALVALLDDLNRLDQAMRARQSEIAGQLSQTSMRRRAVAAYGGSGDR